MIKAIIFDMDGVIVDSAELHFIAWQQFLAKHNKPHSKQDFNKHFGMANKEIFKMLLPEQDPSDYPRLDNEKEAMYRELAQNELYEINGATDLIKRFFDNNYKLIVGSSGHPKNIEFNLDKLGLTKYFQGYVSNHEVDKGKPAPDIFLRCTEKLNISPNECVVIEDVGHGIQAAKKAGMKVIGVATTHDKYALEEADVVVDSLNEISIELINSL